MKRCLLVPDKVRSDWRYRAKIRDYMERAFSNVEVTRVYITMDGKRCLVSVTKLEPLGTERRGYPEFEKKVYDLTFELERAPWGNYTEVPA